MRRRRVLYIANSHPDLYIGGAEVYSYEVYRAMRSSADFEPFFLARSVASAHGYRPESPFHALGDDPNQLLWYQPSHDYFLLTSPDKDQYTVHFDRLLRVVQPDLIHLQHTVGLGVDLIRQIRNRFPGVPIVYTLHEFLPICNAQGLMIRPATGELCEEASPLRCHDCFPDIAPHRFFLREQLIRKHLDLVDLFLVPSYCLIDRFEAWGLPKEKLVFQEYGRLPQTPVAGPDDPPPPSHRFGFFGQLRRHKGVLVLLEAMERLARDGNTQVHLELNGANLEHEPQDFQDAVATALRTCRGQVTFAGRYTSEQIPQRMHPIAWAVVPSTWWENSPLVIQEAFMHGRPVICSDIGGMAEKVRHEVDGLHFRVGDPGDLARVLERAATEPGLWSRLAEQIRPIFSMDDAVVELGSIYQDLLDRASASTASSSNPATPETTAAPETSAAAPETAAS